MTAAAQPVRVRIFYPSDPLGSMPGGIEPFIRGVIGWAPPDIVVSVVGITTDARARPPGRWLELEYRGRRFRQFAVFAVDDPRRQPRIPATLRYVAGLALRPALRRGFDVAEVHRLEPAPLLLLGRRGAPVTAVMHQHSEVVREHGTDIRWRHAPWLYFALEDRIVPRLASVFTVHRAAVDTLRARHPTLGGRIRFTPTWVDTDVFGPADEAMRARRRHAVRAQYALADDAPLLVFVGRLEMQKDPELLLDAFAALGERPPRSGDGAPALLLIGDGTLRARLERRAAALGVADRVRFAGLATPPVINDLLNAADLFVLASRYEGMPIALLEALATGLPAVSTRVGEVSRVLQDGVNGALLAQGERRPEALAAAIAGALAARERLRGEPCRRAVADYRPERVLAPVYANYRHLASPCGR